jgi:hypothetical protein
LLRHRSRLTTRDAPAQASSNYLIVQPQPPVPRPEVWDAAGRYCQILSRALRVFVRTRIALDSVDRDDFWLLNESFGHLQIEEKVLEALSGFSPGDGENNVLVAHPIKFAAIGEPSKDEEPPADWGQSILVFDCQYVNSRVVDYL